MICGIMLGGNSVSGADFEMIHDLEEGPKEATCVVEENNELIDIRISEDSDQTRLSNKSYTITKTKKGNWAISYKVKIKDNKITSTSGGSFKASTGSFSNTSVKKISGSSAIAKGAWKYRSATHTIQVKASIVNKKLTVI